MAQKVRKGEELNEINLKKFLLTHDLISDVNSELDISQFSTGASNLTYRIKIEGHDYVLRRPPFGAIKRGHDMGREYKVLSGLANGFSKSPKAYAYTEDETIIGSSFYIMQMIPGIILDYPDVLDMNITPSDFKLIADKWMETFIELHNLDYEAVGLGDLGRPAGYVERQVRNWAKQYLKAAIDEIPEMTKIMSWLDENQPREYDHSLIHNDYKYNNVVFADNTWQELSAVLDWEMCTLGDPMMDFGASVAYWFTPEDGEMINKGLPSPTALPGNPSRSELVQMYADRTGKSMDNIVFYYVFGLFRTAVIVQQIYYRFHHGYTTNPKFAQFNMAAQMFSTMAWQSIQKGRIDRLF